MLAHVVDYCPVVHSGQLRTHSSDLQLHQFAHQSHFLFVEGRRVVSFRQVVEVVIVQ